jgi:transposase-like protein
MAQGRATTKHRVKLTADERQTLVALVRRGRSAGWKLQRAGALLKCDEGEAGPAWADAKIAQAFDVTTRSVEHWRKQAVDHGPLSLLERKPQDRSKFRKLDGVSEAKLVQLACSTPPEGRARWSLRLLADRLVALEVVDSIGHECVRQALQKTR